MATLLVIRPVCSQISDGNATTNLNLSKTNFKLRDVFRKLSLFATLNDYIGFAYRVNDSRVGSKK